MYPVLVQFHGVRLRLLEDMELEDIELDELLLLKEDELKDDHSSHPMSQSVPTGLVCTSTSSSNANEASALRSMPWSIAFVSVEERW